MAEALATCLVHEGTTGVHENFGHGFAETFHLGIGPGFRCVDVTLTGFALAFRHGEHPIGRMDVRVGNVAYDPETGDVGFAVHGAFRDVDGNDEFTWEVTFSVLALG